MIDNCNSVVEAGLTRQTMVVKTLVAVRTCDKPH